MMGSIPRAADTRLALFGDIVAILKLLSEPDGLKKSAAELQIAHQAAVDDLNRIGDSLEDVKAELARCIAKHEQDTKDLQDREAAVSAREAKAADAEAQHQADHAALVERVEAHKLAEEDLAKRQNDLQTQQDAMAARHQDMVAAHASRVAQAETEATSRSKELDEQQQQLNERSAEFAKAEALLIKRTKAVDAAQKKAEATEQAALAVKAEFEQKLLQLRSLVAGS